MEVQDFNFDYYVMTSKGKLVYGFDDIEEAKNYARVNHYRLCNKKNLEINPAVIENWTTNYPSNGLPTD